MREPRILLADADAFFVAVARAVDPDGAGKAPLLIVGGTRESRGVVCSASYETRKFGVRSAMSITQALKLCPDAMCVPVPGKACAQKSREIREALQRFTPVVEGASVDEWYLDLSGTETLYHHEHLAATAERIRVEVREATQITLSIGGGTNKLIAKLAVDRAKPREGTGGKGVCIIEPGMEQEFLKTLNLADIPMVGPKFQARLAAHGLVTVPDVLRLDLAMLRDCLGEREGEWLWNRVHGVDSGRVVHRESQSSLSRDGTFPRDLDDPLDLDRELLVLVTRAASDLRGAGLTTRCVTVKLRDRDFRTRSAQRALPQPVVSDRVILRVARRLLADLRAARRIPARLLGVKLSHLERDPKRDQLDLFNPHPDSPLESDRDRSVVLAVDRVRAKFGAKSILPAQLT